jgi:hypothetical protein
MSALRSLLVVCLLAAGCSSRVGVEWPETGERRFLGRVERVGGERRSSGFWTFWYPDGVRQAQGWFERGGYPDLSPTDAGGTRVPREGRTRMWSFWDPRQTLLAEGRFEGGLRHDLWACWREDGELCCSGFFAEGRPEGFHVTWKEGRKRDEHSYAAGKLHGSRTVRDAMGRAVWSGEYEDGELRHATPPSAPEPPLHLLERCAEAAEQGLRVELEPERASLAPPPEDARDDTGG